MRWKQPRRSFPAAPFRYSMYLPFRKKGQKHMVQQKILDATDMTAVKESLANSMLAYKPQKMNEFYTKQFHMRPPGVKRIHDRSLHRLQRSYGYGAAFMKPISFRHRSKYHRNDNPQTRVQDTNIARALGLDTPKFQGQQQGSLPPPPANASTVPAAPGNRGATMTRSANSPQPRVRWSSGKRIHSREGTTNTIYLTPTNRDRIREARVGRSVRITGERSDESLPVDPRGDKSEMRPKPPPPDAGRILMSAGNPVTLSGVRTLSTVQRVLYRDKADEDAQSKTPRELRNLRFGVHYP